MSIKHVNKPVNKHTLENLSIKEIINKFPDKTISVEQRNMATYLQLDTCMIIFNKDCPGWDVDASEDGQFIVNCEHKECNKE